MKLSKCGVFLVVLALSFSASAQQWPAKPVSMLVGYAPGGGVDIVARFLAEGLRERLGQPVVIENKPGAVGNIAGQAVARAAPDGYTMLFTANATHAANVHLFKSMPFDPVKDFTPVTTIASLSFILVVDPVTVPVSSVAELTQYLKARPGKLSYASGSATARIAMEMYQSLAGVSAVHIPYKATATAASDVIAGRVQLMFIDTTFGLAQVRAGKLRALAVTQATAQLPGVPTFADAGFPLDVVTSFSVVAPAGTPAPIVQRFATEIGRAMRSAPVAEKLNAQVLVPVFDTPEEFAASLKKERDGWAAFIRRNGIEADQ